VSSDSFTGIALQNAGLANAIDELEQAANATTNSMNELVTDLQPMKNTFHGSAADAFNNLQSVIQQAESRMNDDLNKAVTALSTMKDLHNQADANGARTFG
jgi:uncharacterized protein YukE